MRKTLSIFAALCVVSGCSGQRPVAARPPVSAVTNEAAEQAMLRLVVQIEARDVAALSRPDLDIYTDDLGRVEGAAEFAAFLDELTLVQGRPGAGLLPFRTRRVAVEGDRTLFLSIFVKEDFPAAPGGGHDWRMQASLWLIQFRGQQIVSLRRADELRNFVKIND